MGHAAPHPSHPLHYNTSNQHPTYPLPLSLRIFFKTDLVNDNYFYAGYFLGYYTPENCPRYLRKEHYEKMKSELKVRALNLLCTVL